MTTIPGVDSDLSKMISAVFAEHAATGENSPGLAGSRQPSCGPRRQAGVRIPLAEHDLLAGALLEAASLAIDDRLRTVAELDSSAVAHAVPWASTAASIVTLVRSADSWLVTDVDASVFDEIIIPGTNLVGEPRDRVTVNTGSLRGTPIDDTMVKQYHLKGALARAIQVSAALDRAMMLSCEHATHSHPVRPSVGTVPGGAESDRRHGGRMRTGTRRDRGSTRGRGTKRVVQR